MKCFETRQLHDAIEFSRQGGQALHIHGYTQGGHRLFRRYKEAAHLFDMNKCRLISTARRLGVKKIKIGREGEIGQHIDLCAGPLERARCEAIE